MAARGQCCAVPVIMSRRLAVSAGLALLVLLLVSASWLWKRLEDLAPPPAPPTATAAATRTVTPPAAAPTAPPGYRLAGVAVGDPESFAVVEAPSGANELYRLNEDVPGLGKVIRIEAERVVVQGDAGQFELWLTPAATPTPRPSATAAATPSAPRTPATPGATKGPSPATPGGGTTRGSTPSAVPDRPAS